MLRLAVLSARGRFGAFAGALIALFAAAVLSMAWGMQLESILRTHSPVERYAAAVAVVTGQQETGGRHGVLLGERARVSSGLTARLAAVPGVRAAIGDVSVPALLGDAPVTRLAGHPGHLDAIGVLAAPGFDVARLRAAAAGAQVLTGADRGAAEYPQLERTRKNLIPVTAAFGGLSMFIAMFVVASTL